MLFTGGFAQEWEEGEVRETKFIFIGKNLDREELIAGFLACNAPEEPLRFCVGTRVLAHVEGGYTPGEVIRLWDEGNPYRILLDSGVEVTTTQT